MQNLAGDAELPSEKSQASAAARQKVDQIVEAINQEQEQPVPVPRPVYSKPPKHKKILTAPVPVQHFSDKTSQNPAVRMHDRLLQDAMPKPDPERKPRRAVQNISQKTTSVKNKAKNQKSRKLFHIEIGELPPDIPRDTSVADRIRQEQLEKTLAAVPPKTPEQIRKEQVRKRALEIRERMRQQEELAAQTQTPEPEEDIPAWEEQLAAVSEKNSEIFSDQLQVFEQAEIIPDIASTPSVTEVIMTSGEQVQSAETVPPDLSFQQTVVFQTVRMPKVTPGIKKKAIVTRRIRKTTNLPEQGGIL